MFIENMENKRLLLVLIFIQLFLNSTATINQGKKNYIAHIDQPLFFCSKFLQISFSRLYFYADVKYSTRNTEENLPMLDLNGCTLSNQAPSLGDYCCTADMTNCYAVLSDCWAACNPPSN